MGLLQLAVMLPCGEDVYKRQPADGPGPPPERPGPGGCPPPPGAWGSPPPRRPPPPSPGPPGRGAVSYTHLLIRGADFSCAQSTAQAARDHEKITVLPHTQVEEVGGDDEMCIRDRAVPIPGPCPDRVSIQTMTTMLMGYKRPDYLAKIGRLPTSEATIDMLEDAIEMCIRDRAGGGGPPAPPGLGRAQPGDPRPPHGPGADRGPPAPDRRPL